MFSTHAVNNFSTSKTMNMTYRRLRITTRNTRDYVEATCTSTHSNVKFPTFLIHIN